MSCKNVCKLCRNLVLSTALAYDATTDTLNITIPNNGYRNCEKVCIIVAQAIPATTTRTALVNIVVGASTFPLVTSCCNQATACLIGSRRKYSTCVVTNATTGTFRLLGKTPVCCPDSLDILPIEPATGGGA